MLHKSPTKDETAHFISSGYVFLTKGDLRFDTAHPPLSRYLGALPLLFLDVNLPDDASYWRRASRSEFAYDFFYQDNQQSHLMVTMARLVILIITAAGALGVYSYVRKFYSSAIALIFLFFFSFSPSIIAHARLATTDSLFMIFFMLSLFSFWDFLVRQQTLKRAAIAGLFVGLALLSKYTGVVLIPFYLAYFFIWRSKAPRAGARFILMWIVAFVVVWAGYGFEFRSLMEGTMRGPEKVTLISQYLAKLPFLTEGARQKVISAILHTPFPLSSYVLGLLGVFRHGLVGHGFYFMGQIYSHGIPPFFLIAFLIKTPLALIVLFGTGIMIHSFKDRHNTLNAYFGRVFFYFFLIAAFSKLQLGLRYILNIYPICFLFAAHAVSALWQKRLSDKVVGSVLMAWFVAASISIYPHYLSYFNETVGGPRMGRHFLADSNLDWGQDLIHLADYLEGEGVDFVRLSYDGSAEPVYYGIQYLRTTPRDEIVPQKALYAISTNTLHRFSWALRCKPDHVVANTTYIYDLRD